MVYRVNLCRSFIFVLCKKKYKSGLCLQQVENRFALNHSHKKRKDSLETWAVLLIFLLELEMAWGGRTEHTSKQQKMTTFARNCSVKMTLRLFWPLFVVMTIVLRLLRKFRRSLQIKKCITNVHCVI